MFRRQSPPEHDRNLLKYSGTLYRRFIVESGDLNFTTFNYESLCFCMYRIPMLRICIHGPGPWQTIYQAH